MKSMRWMLVCGLLVVVIAVAMFVAVHRTADESTPKATSSTPAQVADHPAEVAVAGPQPSPAGTELLARVRSCSAKELESVVDKLGAMEAYGLYKQLTVADRQAVFAALPPPLLARKANELLGIPAHHFRHDGKAGLIASSLVDVAMGTAGGGDLAQRKELCFATEVDQQHVPLRPRAAFRADERRIYACLDGGADAASESGVLVRWSEEASGALVYIHYLPFALNQRWNNLYFEVNATWNPGRYRVQFYRISDAVSLVAEGTYVVGGGG